MKLKSLDANQTKVAQKLIRKLTQDKTTQVEDFYDEGYFQCGINILDLDKFENLCRGKYGRKCKDLSVFSNVLSGKELKLLEWLIFTSEIKNFKQFEKLFKSNKYRKIWKANYENS